MYYLAYAGRTIQVLKCASCRSYSLELFGSVEEGKEQEYNFRCGKCESEGDFTLPEGYALEGFATWEELQGRVDELKVSMTITEL